MNWIRQTRILTVAGALGMLGVGCATAVPEQPSPVDPIVAAVVPASTSVPPQEDASNATTPTATPVAVFGGFHEVAPGDTLIDIALRYDVSVDEIVRVNAITNPDLLAVGLQLRIPGDGPGDTAAHTAEPLTVCAENSRVYTLDLPAEPIRLHAAGDTLYLIADGRFYTLLLEDLGRSPRLRPTERTPRDNIAGAVGVQELVYLTQDRMTGDLYVLDKSNDIYRVDPSGEWHVTLQAAQLPGVFPDPQYLALAAHDGVVYILDADLGRIWRVDPGTSAPVAHFLGAAVGAGMDLAMPGDAPGDRFFVLARDGSVTALDVGSVTPRAVRPPVVPVLWPAQIQALDDRLMVVDAEGRRVTFYDQADYAAVRVIEFRYPEMRRVRSVALLGEVLFAVAGPNLIAAPLSALTEECPSVAFDDTIYFDGVDVRTLLPQVDLPFADALLPTRPRSYPGARRLYRHGVHEGLDVYALDVPGLTAGTTVGVIADGLVLRADHGYVELTPTEYEAAEAQTRLEHRTNAELADLFLGQQVHVAHTESVSSIYAHLSSVAPAVLPGRVVIRRTPIGAVGVSGTSAGAYGTSDGVHLHFEIWVNGRYLGQGLSIDETMRIWAALFE